MENKNKILLVEDEESLAEGLKYNLIEEGYDVSWADDGRKAMQIFTDEAFDLIILDIMLPYINGFELAEHIRKTSPRLPVLILTARARIVDKIKGLELGVDDYLTKPFNLQELLLRVKRMLQRKEWYDSSVSIPQVYSFGKNKINFENLIADTMDASVTLTQQEAMVLKYLIENKGKVVTRKELLEKVWNISPDVETRTVDNFISRLRKYFEPDPSNPVYIKSVRSKGYIFEE